MAQGEQGRSRGYGELWPHEKTPSSGLGMWPPPPGPAAGAVGCSFSPAIPGGLEAALPHSLRLSVISPLPPSGPTPNALPRCSQIPARSPGRRPRGALKRWVAAAFRQYRRRSSALRTPSGADIVSVGRQRSVLTGRRLPPRSRTRGFRCVLAVRQFGPGVAAGRNPLFRSTRIRGFLGCRSSY